MTDTPRITTVGGQVIGRFDQNSDPVRITSALGYLLTKKPVRSDTSGISPSSVPFVLHDWNSSFLVESSWDTSVVTSQTDCEDRWSLRDRPTKFVTYSVAGVTHQRMANILDSVRSLTEQRTLWPLLCDGVLVSENNTGETIPGDFAYRRFLPGQRVIVVRPDYDIPTVVSDTYVIDTVSSDHIGITTSPTNGTVQAGDIVYPAFFGEINLNGADIRWLSDAVGVSSIEVQEILGPSATQPIAQANPGDFGIHQGLPIFSVSPNWTEAVERKIKRFGLVTGGGRYPVTSVLGDRPEYMFSSSFRTMNRQEYYRIAQFFHWRKGRSEPFWFVSPDTALSHVATGTSSVTVLPFGKTGSVAAGDIGQVAIVKKNGEVLIRNVSSVLVGGTYWQLVLDSPIGNLYAAEIEKVTTAHKSRFESDSLSESWRTDIHCDISLSVKELLQESTIDIDDYELDMPFPKVFGLNTDPVFWFDAAKHCYQDRNRLQEARKGDSVYRADDARESPSWPEMIANSSAALADIGISSQEMGAQPRLVFTSAKRYDISPIKDGLIAGGDQPGQCTLLFCFKASGTGSYTLFFEQAGLSEVLITCSAGVFFVANRYNAVTQASISLGTLSGTIVLAYVLENGVRNKVYVNGSESNLSSSSVTLGASDTPTCYTFPALSLGTMLLYDEALSVEDIEIAANNLVLRFDAGDSWDITP